MDCIDHPITNALPLHLTCSKMDYNKSSNLEFFLLLFTAIQDKIIHFQILLVPRMTILQLKDLMLLQMICF